MYALPKKIENLAPYIPDDVSGMVNLSANEGCFALSEKTFQKVKEEILKVNFNRYPNTLAENLIEAFSDFYKLDKNMVTAGNGSDELISLILQTFLSKSDRYIILEPDFSMYAFYGRLLGINFASLKKDLNTNKINFKFLKDYINQNNISAVIFSNPCNPTSLAENYEDVLDFVKSVSCLVVIDEAYMDFSKGSLLNDVSKLDNLIVLKTMSKAFCMAALRLGFAISNKTITNVLRAAKSPYNVNTVSALIASLALNDKKYVDSCINSTISYRENLKKEIAKFSKIFDVDFKMFDSAANFLYIKTKRCKQIFEYLKTQNILIRCFEKENALRITVGNENENKILSEKLKEISRCENTK